MSINYVDKMENEPVGIKRLVNRYASEYMN